MLDKQWIQESWFYIQFRFDDFEIVNVQAKTCRCLLLATNVLLWYFPLNFTSSSKAIDVYWYTVFVYFNQFITRLERITSISSPFPVPSFNFWVRLIYNPRNYITYSSWKENVLLLFSKAFKILSTDFLFHSTIGVSTDNGCGRLSWFRNQRVSQWQNATCCCLARRIMLSIYNFDFNSIT